MTADDIGEMDIQEFTSHASYAAAVMTGMGVKIPE
jgi:hypothetical protein